MLAARRELTLQHNHESRVIARLFSSHLESSDVESGRQTQIALQRRLAMWKNNYQPETFVERVRLILSQLRHPSMFLYGYDVMKRVYSTPSLLFLALLAVAIWSWSISSLLPQQPAPPR